MRNNYQDISRSGRGNRRPSLAAGRGLERPGNTGIGGQVNIPRLRIIRRVTGTGDQMSPISGRSDARPKGSPTALAPIVPSRPGIGGEEEITATGGEVVSGGHFGAIRGTSNARPIGCAWAAAIPALADAARKIARKNVLVGVLRQDPTRRADSRHLVRVPHTGRCRQRNRHRSRVVRANVADVWIRGRAGAGYCHPKKCAGHVRQSMARADEIGRRHTPGKIQGRIALQRHIR